MNIVDVIKSQLTGDVLGKLSSLIGESEDKTKTAATAAVPGLLSILANLASTSSGADKVINALKQVDTGSQGGFGDILAGPEAHEVQEKGGSLLNILLGASALPILLNILGKFAGIAAGPAKSLLSMLAPLILSSIAKSFAGKSLTSQALSSFFTEQKGNISSAATRGPLVRRHPGPDGSHHPFGPHAFDGDRPACGSPGPRGELWPAELAPSPGGPWPAWRPGLVVPGRAAGRGGEAGRRYRNGADEEGTRDQGRANGRPQGCGGSQG